MTSTLAHVRRAVDRFVTGAPVAPAVARVVTVPVTVRAHTADGADIRLLIDIHVEDAGLPPPDLAGLVYALAVPAVRRWVADRDLAGLQAGLAPSFDEVSGSVKDGLSEVGIRQLGIELVAAEHLLCSPSADAANGPD